MIRVGIVGNGFVGGAHARALSTYVEDVQVCDIDPRKSTCDIATICKQDIAIICVPTPMLPSGEVNASYVRDVLEKLRGNLLHRLPVIIKSTLPPSALDKLFNEFGEELFLVFSPEFLTERTADLDLQQSNRIILGIRPEDMQLCAQSQMVKLLFDCRWPGVPQYWTHYKAASLAKYTCNVFFGVKITLLNEIAELCSAVGVDYKQVIQLALTDPRIGRSHYKVPGHDGKKGYSGSCLPKDTIGYMKECEKHKLSATIAKGAWSANLRMRGAEVVAEELSNMTRASGDFSITVDTLKKLAC